jgi:hypothetical protein
VGLPLGLKLGTADGDPLVGMAVGGRTGLADGRCLDGDGLFDLLMVGYGVGGRDGRWVGFGRIDGEEEGFWEGLNVGLPLLGRGDGLEDTGRRVGGHVKPSRLSEFLLDNMFITFPIPVFSFT